MYTTRHRCSEDYISCAGGATDAASISALVVRKQRTIVNFNANSSKRPRIDMPVLDLLVAYTGTPSTPPLGLPLASRSLVVRTFV